MKENTQSLKKLDPFIPDFKFDDWKFNTTFLLLVRKKKGHSSHSSNQIKVLKYFFLSEEFRLFPELMRQQIWFFTPITKARDRVILQIRSLNKKMFNRAKFMGTNIYWPSNPDPWGFPIRPKHDMAVPQK